MRAGVRRGLLRIDTMQSVRDQSGGVINVPILFTEAWTQLEPIAGREYFAAGGIQAEVDYRAVGPEIDLRGVKPDMFATDEDGIVYDVQAARRMGNGDEIELFLKERVA